MLQDKLRPLRFIGAQKAGYLLQQGQRLSIVNGVRELRCVVRLTCSLSSNFSSASNEENIVEYATLRAGDRHTELTVLIAVFANQRDGAFAVD